MLNEKHRFYSKTKVISTEELQNKFQSRVFNYVEIVLLFGSRGVGKFHDRSDYDFAVVVSEDLHNAWGELSDVWIDIGREFGLNEIDYDVVDLLRATPEMKRSISKGYKILKGEQSDISRILDTY